jgi:uncharacterized RDD family membrane protein YckC
MSDAYTPQPETPGGYGGQPPSGPSGPRADFVQRLLAALIDGVIVGIPFAILYLALHAFGYLIGVLGAIAYGIYFEAGPAGQTVGKRAMGIRVIRLDTGGPLGWGPAAIRYVVRSLISGLLCGLGYWWMLWDKERQTWHDKAAGTIVVPVSAYPPPPDSFGQPPAPS